MNNALKDLNKAYELFDINPVQIGIGKINKYIIPSGILRNILALTIKRIPKESSLLPTKEASAYFNR